MPAVPCPEFTPVEMSGALPVATAVTMSPATKAAAAMKSAETTAETTAVAATRKAAAKAAGSADAISADAAAPSKRAAAIGSAGKAPPTGGKARSHHRGPLTLREAGPRMRWRRHGRRTVNAAGIKSIKAAAASGDIAATIDVGGVERELVIARLAWSDVPPGAAGNTLHAGRLTGRELTGP